RVTPQQRLSLVEDGGGPAERRARGDRVEAIVVDRAADAVEQVEDQVPVGQRADARVRRAPRQPGEVESRLAAEPVCAEAEEVRSGRQRALALRTDAEVERRRRASA